MIPTAKTDFFVMTPPGFERITELELQWWWPFLKNRDGGCNTEPFPEINAVKGGLEFSCSLCLGLQLNYLLKSAGRIVFRVLQFEARTFPDLEKGFKRLNLQFLLKMKLPLSLSINASHSKINNEKRIQLVLVDVLKSKGFELSEAGQILQVRMVDDICTVSVDTSGEHLHRRGYREHTSEAPIRENLAAALLLSFIGHASLGELSQVRLIDPMAGSGTFLCEGSLLFQPLCTRTYQFEKWEDLSSLRKILYSQESFGAYLAQDVNSKALAIMKHNFSKLGFNQVTLEQKDLFTEETMDASDLANWVVINPPYGDRLQLAKPIEVFYEEIFCAVENKYQPQRVGVIVPRRKGQKKIATPKGWQFKKSLVFENGGIPVTFLIYTCN